MGAVFSDSGRPGPGFPENGNHRTLLISTRYPSAWASRYASTHQAITFSLRKLRFHGVENLPHFYGVNRIVALAVLVIANEGLSDGLMSVFAVPLTPRFRLSYSACRSVHGALARVAHPATHPFSQLGDKGEERVVFDRLRHVI